MDELDIQAFLADARKGKWLPVNILVGAETFLIERAAKLLKKAAIGTDGVPGFNDDLFHGQGLQASRVAAAARTVPMMSPNRFVLVRDLESVPASELDGLVDLVQKPSPSTCLVLIGEKLDGKTKLAKAAKAAADAGKAAYLKVEPLKGPLLERFVLGECKRRRATLQPDALGLLLDAIGNDLASLEDAIEKLSLYVASEGQEAVVGRAAVEAVVHRVRVDTVWTLVDAISLKKAKVALDAVGSMLEDREPALPILGMIARQLRMIAKMKSALAQGAARDEATRIAGAPPFKARDLAESAKRFSEADLARAFRVLAETDQTLKGSRQDPDRVLERAIVALVR